MAATNFSGPVVSTGGFTGDVTGDVVGNVIAASLSIPTYPASEIADAAEEVNTTNKAAGVIVFDSTNSKLKIATGATDTDTWVDADGTNAVTPS